MKNKASRRLIVILASLIITTFVGMNVSADSITANTTTDVNLRVAGGLDSPVITVVDPNTSVTILNMDNPSWYQVQLSDGTVGYIFSQYLNTQQAPYPDTPTETVTNLYITTEFVNLRSGKSTDTTVITVVEPGIVVTVTDKSDPSWFGVNLVNGQTGYLYSSYLNPYYITAPPTTPTPPTQPMPPETNHPDPTPPSGGQVVETYITNEYVNLRSGRSTDASVITVVDQGIVVTVTDKSDPSWYGVTLSNGQTGYIYSIYLNQHYTPNPPTPPSPPVTTPPTPPETILPDPTPPSGGQVVETYITNEYVNLRSGRSTDTSVITVVDQGIVVTVTDKSDPSWYGVTLVNGQTGYIYSIYLNQHYTPTPPAPPETVEPSEPKDESYITTEYVNLRTGRGTNTSVITVVDSGTKLTVTDKSDPAWYGVKLKDGKTGFISSQYLRVRQIVNPNANIEYLKTINSESYSPIVEVAKSQLGNDWKKYCNSFGISTRVEWCAIFASWCAKESGMVPDADFIYSYGTNSDIGHPSDSGSGAGDHARFADKNGRYHSTNSNYIPKSGDFIFIDRSESMGNIGYLVMDHIAIVEKVENGVVHTIDGNLSKDSDTRDLVRREQYNMWDIIVAGYAEN